jgi:hypothetical protein
MEALKNFIFNNLMEMSFGEYEGMVEDISLSELYQLRGLVEAAMIEKQPNLILPL